MNLFSTSLAGLLVASLVALGTAPRTATAAGRDAYTNCLTDQIEKASDTDTIGTIREACESFQETAQPATDSGPVATPGLVGRRVLLEKDASRNRFAITQHRSSYILPVTHNGKVNNTPFRVEDENRELDNAETKFQFSLKAQLFDAVLNDRGRVFFGYTNKSFWQVYDGANSKPFRETNHEPELFIDIDQNKNLGSWRLPLLRLGLVHQSNGQSGTLSRSWNRLYGEVFAERGKYAVSLKPWIWLDSDDEDSDNPDIDDFMGNFELGMFRQGETSATSVLLRNNLRSENRGAIEINWSKPVPYNKKLRFLVQYFYGYGESLIDYDAITNRIGIGLQLSDFL